MVVLGGIRRALGGRKGSWIESVSVEELEKEMLRVENQISVIAREIERLEKRKKELFQQGIGKSDIEKLLIAEKIKDLDTEIKMKIKEYNRLMKQRRALSNLIRLKRWEARLKEKGIWENIKNVEPDKLIQMLSEVQFEEDQFERNLDKINEILGRQAAEIEVDEDTKQILELWEKVEKSELTPEAAMEQVAQTKREAREDREKETI